MRRYAGVGGGSGRCDGAAALKERRRTWKRYRSLRQRGIFAPPVPAGPLGPRLEGYRLVVRAWSVCGVEEGLGRVRKQFYARTEKTIFQNWVAVNTSVRD